MLEVGIDRFVAGGNFPVLKIFDEQVDKSALDQTRGWRGTFFSMTWSFRTTLINSRSLLVRRPISPLRTLWAPHLPQVLGALISRFFCQGFWTEGKGLVFPQTSLGSKINQSGEENMAQIPPGGFWQ